MFTWKQWISICNYYKLEKSEKYSKIHQHRMKYERSDEFVCADTDNTAQYNIKWNEMHWLNHWLHIYFVHRWASFFFAIYKIICVCERQRRPKTMLQNDEMHKRPSTMNEKSEWNKKENENKWWNFVKMMQTAWSQCGEYVCAIFFLLLYKYVFSVHPYIWREKNR